MGDAHTFRSGFYFGEYGVEADNTSQAFPIDGRRAADRPRLNHRQSEQDQPGLRRLSAGHLATERKAQRQFRSRWDRVSGLVNDSQFSPTINFVYKPRRDTTLHAGFARNFQIPNFQGISPGIAALQGTTGGVGPGIPLNTELDAETDYTWDVGYMHQFTPHLVFAQDSYFRIDRHYIDEGHLASCRLTRPSTMFEVMAPGSKIRSLTTFRSLALRGTRFVAREEVRGVATGQYNFPPAAQLEYIDNHYIVLDHTPLVGASAEPLIAGRYQFTFDGLFSSGLRGGFANEEQLPKVWQFNLSGARELQCAGLRQEGDGPNNPAEHF